MKELPHGLQSYKKTKIFNERSVPEGLLNDHSTKDGVWGIINILKGKLIYTIQSTPPELVLLSPDRVGIVEPKVLHNVKPEGKVSFYVEFYR